MLTNLSEQIRECHMHAEHCAQQARVQIDPKLKDAYLGMERRWLMLARSYEFTQRLTDFSDETKRQLDILPKKP
jgi:hypothetical protein